MAGPAIDPRVSAQWARIRGALRAALGESAYRAWLKPLTLLAVEGGTVRIATPTRFMRDWVANHYAEQILTLWAEESPAVATLDIQIQSEPEPVRRERRRPPAATKARRDPGGKVAGRGPARRRGPADAEAPEATRPPAVEIGAPLDPRCVFDTFVVGKPNALAHAAAQHVAELQPDSYNPLFLHGGVGLGKTHLMHAIGWQIRQRHPDRRVVLLSAERFMYQFVRALQTQDTMAFKERFRSVDVLMIDDLQFIDGKESTQEEFFHTFNDVVDNKRQVVVAADRSPSGLEGVEERLRSRLGAGLVVDVRATTYELRIGILRFKADQLGIEIPVKVMEFLAHKITASVRELEGALNRVVAHATLIGREISLETCQDVLHDLLRANDRRVTIDDIQKRVAAHFDIRIDDMRSKRKAIAIARPRQVAMYLAKQLTSRSLPEIGRKFGRDHSTVSHAVRKVEELRGGDPGFDEDVELLRRMLTS